MKLQQSIIIDRPVEEVFAYRSALHQTAEWQRNVIATDLFAVGPIALGSRGTEQRLGQREVLSEWELEVTEFELNSVLGIMSRCGDVRLEERVVLAPDEANTRYTVCLEMTGSRLPTAAFHRANDRSVNDLQVAPGGPQGRPPGSRPVLCP